MMALPVFLTDATWDFPMVQTEGGNMISLGVDVLVLAACGLTLVVGSLVMSALVPLSQEQGVAAVVATAVTALSMLVTYVVMAKVLDATLGVMGW